MHSNTIISNNNYSVRALRCPEEPLGYIRIEVSAHCKQNEKEPAKAGTDIGKEKEHTSGKETSIGSITILDRAYDRKDGRKNFSNSPSSAWDTPVTSFSAWVEPCRMTLAGNEPIHIPPRYFPSARPLSSLERYYLSSEAKELATAACAYLFGHGVEEIGFFTEDMDIGDLYAKALGFQLFEWDNSGWYPVYYYRKCPEQPKSESL